MIETEHRLLKLLVKSAYIRDFLTWLANFVLCEVRTEAEGAAFYKFEQSMVSVRYEQNLKTRFSIEHRE
jgi:hypothetical protein